MAESITRPGSAGGAARPGKTGGMTFYVEWRVGDDSQIPPEVSAAAERGVPIVALVPEGAAIDGHEAELLEECAAVVRGDYAGYESKLSGLIAGFSPSAYAV